MGQKIQMLLGALVFVVGGSIAAYDAMRTGSEPLGATCGGSEHCQTGQCLTIAEDSVCASECDVNNATSCPSGFSCEAVQVEYVMGTEHHAMGTSGYCLAAPTTASR